MSEDDRMPSSESLRESGKPERQPEWQRSSKEVPAAQQDSPLGATTDDEEIIRMRVATARRPVANVKDPTSYGGLLQTFERSFGWNPFDLLRREHYRHSVAENDSLAILRAKIRENAEQERVKQALVEKAAFLRMGLKLNRAWRRHIRDRGEGAGFWHRVYQIFLRKQHRLRVHEEVRLMQGIQEGDFLDLYPKSEFDLEMADQAKSGIFLIPVMNLRSWPPDVSESEDEQGLAMTTRPSNVVSTPNQPDAAAGQWVQQGLTLSGPPVHEWTEVSAEDQWVWQGPPVNVWQQLAPISENVTPSSDPLERRMRVRHLRDEELSLVLVPDPVLVASGEQTQGRTRCTYWLSGMCRWGQMCRWRHDDVPDSEMNNARPYFGDAAGDSEMTHQLRRIGDRLQIGDRYAAGNEDA